MHDVVASSTFQDELSSLAKHHRLVVVEEIGMSGPCYRVMNREDADLYMALVYDYRPGNLH